MVKMNDYDLWWHVFFLRLSAFLFFIFFILRSQSNERHRIAHFVAMVHRFCHKHSFVHLLLLTNDLSDLYSAERTIMGFILKIIKKKHCSKLITFSSFKILLLFFVVIPWALKGWRKKGAKSLVLLILICSAESFKYLIIWTKITISSWKN